MKNWLLLLAPLGAVLFAGPVRADYLLIIVRLGAVAKPPDAAAQPGTPPGQSPRNGPGYTTPPGYPPGGGNPYGGGSPSGEGGSSSEGGNAAAALAGVDVGDPNVNVMVATRVGRVLPAEFNKYNRDFKFVQAPNDFGGRTTLYHDGQTVEIIRLPISSIANSFREKNARVGGSDRNPNNLLGLAQTAAEYCLLEEANNLMLELDKVVGKNIDKQPPHVRSALAAYKKVSEEIKKTPAKNPRAEELRSALGFRLVERGYHALVFKSDLDEDAPEVKSRLAALDTHLRLFYTWFALRGVALPLPAKQLVNVQVELADDYKKIVQGYAATEDVPVDGFYHRADNVCVFSAQRLDPAARLFATRIQDIASKGWEIDKLVQGIFPVKWDDNLRDFLNRLKRNVPEASILEPARLATAAQDAFSDIARMETYGLVDRALKTEAERAAVSSLSTLQLLAAADVLPAAAPRPRWLQSGSASLLGTPKGPFPGIKGSARVAFWPTAGAANWAFMRPLREWLNNRRKPPADANALVMDEPLTALKRTLTDEYFTRKASGESEEDSQLRARAMSWALTFFLARRPGSQQPGPDGLLNLMRAYGTLPPDLELDEVTAVDTFAGVYGLMREDRSGVDESKLRAFADEWMKFLETTPSPGAELIPNLDSSATKAGQPKPEEKKTEKRSFNGVEVPDLGDSLNWLVAQPKVPITTTSGEGSPYPGSGSPYPGPGSTPSGVRPSKGGFGRGGVD